MKKLLFLASMMALPFFGNAQTYFSDNFDDEDVSDWTRYDVDGDGLHWADYFQVTDGAGTPVTPISLISRSWQQTPKTPNNWIISPAVNLTSATGNIVLSWKVQCSASQWDQEHYSVYVGTSSDMASLEASSVTFSETYDDPADAGTQYTRTLDVSSFAGQTIYIAFRHHNVTDMDFISIDDVTVRTPATEAPGCGTQTAPANGAVDVNHVQTTLTWTAPTTGGAAEEYEVYLDTNADPTTLVATVSGTSYTPTTLLPDNTYYWRIVPKNTAGSAEGCSVSSFTTAFVEMPDCPTIINPVNGATDVEYLTGVAISWSAATTGGTPLSYNVYIGTDQSNLELLGNITGTAANITNLLPSTTYYWYVTGVNDGGESPECTVNSFTTVSSPFEPYCGPLAMSFSVEPISNVNFAGINNASSPIVGESPAHEDFISVVGNVTAGETYEIRLQGNTGGNYTNRFAVFIDWNQNGVLNDAGEVYEVTQTLVNSTGEDGKESVHSIAVPADALEGDTRMRVKKIFGTSNYLNPCLGASFGQAEDYTITVATLGVSNATKNALQVYPNPVVDMLNINADSKVKSVNVYDAAGKLVSSHVLNAAKNQVNLSRLSAGVYVVSVETEKGTQTVKVIKK